VITTSHGVLNALGETEGAPTGVAASELTHPYYGFLDAGMRVDVASVKGGEIPIDPQTLSYVIRSPEDDRFLDDPALQAKVQNSLSIDDLDFPSTTRSSLPEDGVRPTTSGTRTYWQRR
jgi:putative intracellular protease/amidase